MNHSGKSHSVKLIPPKFMAGPVQSGAYVCKTVRVVADKKIRISVEIIAALLATSDVCPVMLSLITSSAGVPCCAVRIISSG